MIKKHLLAWIPMIFLAILNGGLRDFTYAQMVSQVHAHQISTVTLIFVFTIYVWFLGRIWPLASLRQAALVGTVWLTLTVAFEFAMGRFISGLSWEEMFRAYDISSGNLWILVPLAVALLPSLMFLTGRKTA